MENEIKRLKRGLPLSIVKKDSDKRTSSIAYSRSGQSYLGSYIGSDTHLLDIPSEQVALLLSVQSNDFGVEKIVTMIENPKKGVTASPLVMKTIIDHARRTSQVIKYTVVNKNGKIIFETQDIQSSFSFYKPKTIPLKKVKSNSNIKTNKISLDKKVTDVKSVLKKYALMGITRNFPTSDSASGYGTAVLTEDNTIYFSGQYSSFDKCTNIHSEMAATLAAFMDGDYKLRYLGLVSTKFKTKPTQMCGCCRQFIAEMMSRFNFRLQIFCFAHNSDIQDIHSPEEYLPHLWTSQKW